MARSVFDLEKAHKHSSKNRTEIEKSVVAGCFSCEKIFNSSEIVEYTDKGETALCPFCGVDAIIANESGIYISPDLLNEMKEYCFDQKNKERKR